MMRFYQKHLVICIVLIVLFFVLMLGSAWLWRLGITILDFHMGPRPFFAQYLLLVVPLSLLMIAWSVAAINAKKMHRLCFYACAALAGSVSLLSVVQTIQLYQSEISRVFYAL